MIPKGEFKSNWTGKVRRNFKQFRKDMAKRPCKYLEIGVFEGRSAMWVIHELLRHPESKYIGIDPFLPIYKKRDGNLRNPEQVEARARKNLSFYGDKATIIKTDSVAWLKTDPVSDQYFDFIYVDGNHTMRAALLDMMLAWPKLKVGGIFVIDDYSKWSVKLATNAFLYSHHGLFERLFHKRRQVAIRKLSHDNSDKRPTRGKLWDDRLDGIAGIVPQKKKRAKNKEVR